MLQQKHSAYGGGARVATPSVLSVSSHRLLLFYLPPTDDADVFCHAPPVLV